MSEVRLIDANALRKTIEHLFKVYKEKAFDHFYTEVLFAIDNAPTVEPDCLKCKQYEDGYNYGRNIGYNEGKKDRPQGEWIYQPNHTYLDNVQKYHCSTNKCGWQQNYKTNFCPNCGADMRKPFERPKPHPAAFCDGDCVHCKILDECEKADGGES